MPADLLITSTQDATAKPSVPSLATAVFDQVSLHGLVVPQNIERRPDEANVAYSLLRGGLHQAGAGSR